MMILEELDKTFQYDDQVQVEMPRAFEKFFYDGLSRRDGQTLINYVADHREYLMEVERHGVNIPEKVAGWLLLRRAGLTMEQKQLVQGRAKELDHLVPPKPSSARTIKGKSHEGRNWRGKEPPRDGEDNTKATPWKRPTRLLMTKLWRRSMTTTIRTGKMMEEGEDDGEAETDEAYYNEAANEEPIDEFFWEAEQQYEEDYATYLDARRQMAHLKASRGFYPVVALTSGGQAASSKCLKCGQPGHWAASCPQNTARSSPILPGRALLRLLRHHLQRSLELMGPR